MELMNSLGRALLAFVWQPGSDQAHRNRGWASQLEVVAELPAI
jgi:hypothetical protein